MPTGKKGDTGGGTTAQSINFDQIDIKCTKEYMLAFGLEECEYLCEDLRCKALQRYAPLSLALFCSLIYFVLPSFVGCFDDDCDYPNQLDCNRAKACNNFYNPTEDLIIERLCSEEELENNESPCQDACQAYECE